MSFGRLIHRLSLFAALSMMAAATPAHAAGQTLGQVISRVTGDLGSFPNVLSTFAYISGLFLIVVGIFKFKDHVDNPTHNPLSAGVKRFLAGGAMFSLPYLQHALFGTLAGGGGGAQSVSGTPQTVSGNGMDKMIVDFITNIYGPSLQLIDVFVYISGFILLIVGVSRMVKTAQEGPRGPTGLGTIMTFLVAGGLFAFGDMMGSFADSLFGTSTAKTITTIDPSIISNGQDAQRIAAVVQALMAFILIVGVIAFARGLFLLKSFADGHQQQSLAQALTFLFGGALAINLGELVNVLQNTVGVSGITFN